MEEYDNFLLSNEINECQANKYGITKDFYYSILIDALKSQDKLLSDSLSITNRFVSKCKKIHSIRFRVKDPEHLIEKIYRKRIKNDINYTSLNKDNYKNIIDDLIGVRVLLLFKEDVIDVDKYVRNEFEILQNPEINYSIGDDLDYLNDLPDDVLKKPHENSYRSLHYVLKKDDIKFELQVRTLSQEIWGEIDHKYNYPNNKPTNNTVSALNILNTLTKVTDDVSSYISISKIEQEKLKKEYDNLQKERDKILLKLEILTDGLKYNDNEPSLKSDIVETVKSLISKDNEKNEVSKKLNNIADAFELKNIRIGQNCSTMLAPILYSDDI